MTATALPDANDPAGWPDLDPPLLTTLFAKHQGRSYPQPVAMAQQVRVYREQGKGAVLRHVATFAHRGAGVGGVGSAPALR